MKKPGLIFFILFFAYASEAQVPDCTLKSPQFTIHFGTGIARDPNTGSLSTYRRVSSSCPTDGHYSLASYSRACFNDDWHTLEEDHTPGDVEGNMLLVNASYEGGTFLRHPVSGLKSNTIYELGFYVMNLCQPSDKCPFPLLPRLNIRLETPEGRPVAKIVTGDLTRVVYPKWTHHTVFFTTPASASSLVLVMDNNVPGGCGNDFAMDDITFRECVVPVKEVPAPPKSKPSPRKPVVQRTLPKKTPEQSKRKAEIDPARKLKADSVSRSIAAVRPLPKIFPPPPLVLKTRENALVKRIETEEGEIKIELYDNGTIDGDTVSIYHNNVLIRSHQRLSQKPIPFSVSVNPSQAHHEIIMVAENLGSIPPNTSVMIITAGNNRYELMISSSEQKNAKVVFDLRK